MSLMSVPTSMASPTATKPPPLMSLMSIDTKFSPMPPQQQASGLHLHRHEDEDVVLDEHAKKKRDLEAAYHEFKMLLMQDLALSMHFF